MNNYSSNAKLISCKIMLNFDVTCNRGTGDDGRSLSGTYNGCYRVNGHYLSEKCYFMQHVSRILQDITEYQMRLYFFSRGTEGELTKAKGLSI